MDRERRFLWAPGMKQAEDEKRCEKLAGYIRLMCTEPGGWCVIGARGEAAAANAMRSLAWASEIGKSPIDFKVRWEEELNDERSLRFFCEIRETWTEWKKRWTMVDTPEKPLVVTPHTDVTKLSTAVVVRHRKFAGAAIKMKAQHDTVLSTAAKALATIPSTGREEVGKELSCVIRWPRLKETEKDEALKMHVFGHVMWRDEGHGFQGFHHAAENM